MGGAPRDIAHGIAESLDAEPELLPVLPELLVDLEDLGARASDVVATLSHAALAPGSRGLDLGCGKGAAALAVARHFGLSIDGVDGLPAFVDHATARARALGLQDLCRFALQDLRERVTAGGDYDLVMLLALGDVLGTPADTIGMLRACVKPGGYMLIDEAYLAHSTDGLPSDLRDALAGCHDRATTIAQLQTYGDVVVHEHVVDDHDDRAYYTEVTGRIAARSEQLARRYPDLAGPIGDYAARQRDEVALLSGPVVGAMWLLQRRDP